ncbi:MAG TPA: hypothetical protein VE010_17600 [Thermoanaerobaculia bacterium]|nr:hypothetical protein [Thermoanaerobaculia bacterium]
MKRVASLVIAVAFMSVARSNAAQPVLGVEHTTSSELRRGLAVDVAAPQVAIARDRSGVAIAWTMRDENRNSRIHVARLDASGNIAGEVRRLPLAIGGREAHAKYPSLTAHASGDGFVAGWLEIASDARGAYAVLHASLAPTIIDRLPVRLSTATPALVRTAGATTWITAGGRLGQLDAQGRLVSASELHASATDVAVANGQLQLIAGQQVRTDSWTCSPEPGCMMRGAFSVCYCKVYRYTYALKLLQPGLTADLMFPFASEAAAAIEADRERIAVAWFRGQQANGGEVVVSFSTASGAAAFAQAAQTPIVLAPFAADRGPTRPDIAMDGSRTIVVWRTTTAVGDHDVVAASIDADGEVERFDVATSAADERDPAIFALGNGSFLIAYEKVISGSTQTAWRIASFSGRRRSVR